MNTYILGMVATRFGLLWSQLALVATCFGRKPTIDTLNLRLAYQ